MATLKIRTSAGQEVERLPDPPRSDAEKATEVVSPKRKPGRPRKNG